MVANQRTPTFATKAPHAEFSAHRSATCGAAYRMPPLLQPQPRVQRFSAHQRAEWAAALQRNPTSAATACATVSGEEAHQLRPSRGRHIEAMSRSTSCSPDASLARLQAGPSQLSSPRGTCSSMRVLGVDIGHVQALMAAVQDDKMSCCRLRQQPPWSLSSQWRMATSLQPRSSRLPTCRIGRGQACPTSSWPYVLFSLSKFGEDHVILKPHLMAIQ